MRAHEPSSKLGKFGLTRLESTIIARLNEQRERLPLFNEKYWGKFFHRSVETCRQRSSILRVKGDCIV